MPDRKKMGFKNLRRNDGVILFITVSVMTIMIVLSLSFWVAVQSEMTDIKEDYSVEQTYQAAVSLNDWLYDYMATYTSVSKAAGGIDFSADPIMNMILTEMNQGDIFVTGKEQADGSIKNVIEGMEDYGDCSISVNLKKKETDTDPVTGAVKTRYEIEITSKVENGKNSESFTRDCVIEVTEEEIIVSPAIPEVPGVPDEPAESVMWDDLREITVTEGAVNDAYSTLINIVRSSWENGTYDLKRKSISNFGSSNYFKSGMELKVYYSGGDIQLYVMGKNSSNQYQWADVKTASSIQTLNSSQISAAGITLPGTISDVNNNIYSLSEIASSIDPFEVKLATFTYNDMIAGIDARRASGDISFTYSQVYKIATQLALEGSIIRRIELTAPGQSKVVVWDQATQKAIYKDAPKSPSEGIYNDMLTIVTPESATDPTNNILGVESFNFIREGLEFYAYYTGGEPRLRIIAGADKSINVTASSTAGGKATFTYDDITSAIGSEFTVDQITKIVLQNQLETTALSKIAWYNEDSLDINGDPIWLVEPVEEVPAVTGVEVSVDFNMIGYR